MKHMQVQAAGYLLDHVISILSLAKVRQLKQSPSPSRQCLVSSRCFILKSPRWCRSKGPALQIFRLYQEALLPRL